MKRAIVASGVLAPAALGELKGWLAITTTGEDDALEGLLRAALEACEGFTGLMPLEAECEEVLPACAGWQRLMTRPVQAISAVETIAEDGARVALAPDAFESDLDADGGGRVRLLQPDPPGRIAVRFAAGLASGWDALPEGLRHGVVRLAAHHYRERDAEAARQPPSAIAALWRPWRRMRLA